MLFELLLLNRKFVSLQATAEIVSFYISFIYSGIIRKRTTFPKVYKIILELDSLSVRGEHY